MFEMKDPNLLISYLGIQIKQIKKEILLSHMPFALKIVKEFNVTESNFTLTPLEIKLRFN